VTGIYAGPTAIQRYNAAGRSVGRNTLNRRPSASSIGSGYGASEIKKRNQSIRSSGYGPQPKVILPARGKTSEQRKRVPAPLFKHPSGVVNKSALFENSANKTQSSNFRGYQSSGMFASDVYKSSKAPQTAASKTRPRINQMRQASAN